MSGSPEDRWLARPRSRRGQLDASRAQAQAAAYWLRAVCEQTLEEPTLEVDGRAVTLRRDPIGVVGAIISLERTTPPPDLEARPRAALGELARP